MLQFKRSSPRHGQRSIDLVARAAVLASTLVILHLTLAPYRFGFATVLTKYSSSELILKFLNGPSDPADMINNIVLFLPLGFSLAWLLQRCQQTKLIARIAPLIAGAGLSLMVEGLQLFLPTRTSTPIDVLTNSLGALLGLLIFHGLQMIFRSHTTMMLALTVWLLMAFTVTIPLQSAAKLTNWDLTFPLLIGGERLGLEPWQGQVFNVAIADTVLTERQIQALTLGVQSPTTFGDTFIAAYQFSGNGKYPDRMGQVADLSWKGDAPVVQARDSITLTHDHWLETDESAAPLTRKIAQTAQFTLITTIASANPAQEGAIISLSSDVAGRNFALGQEEDHLTFFLRTPMTGDEATHIPELFVPEVFASTRLRQVVVTYDHGTFQFYIDGVRQPQAQIITPEYTFFGYLLPPQVASWMQHKLLNPDERFVFIYILLFESLLFLPLGLLLALLMRHLTPSLAPHLRSRLLIGGIILPALLLEVERVVAGGQPIRWTNLVLSLLLTVSSWAFFYMRTASWESRDGWPRFSAIAHVFSPKRTPPTFLE